MNPNPDAPEFRHDILSGRWVVLAPERARRPLGLSNVKPHARSDIERDVCPFCPGHEADTPPAVLSVAADGTPAADDWQVRVVPNKFPAVKQIAPDTRGLTMRWNVHTLPGYGVHEVVIEGADHKTDPTLLSDEVYQRVLLVYRDRIRAFAADKRLDYAAAFKNVGAEAGASMAHLHSQLVATPFVPNDIRDEIAGAEAAFREYERCEYCNLAKPSEAKRARWVAESANFLAVCPFAPRFGYETWVLPKAHDSHYESITDAGALELAGLFKRVLAAVDVAVGTPAYNYYLHTAPLRSDPLPHYHWHFEIVPRTARPAGFEWGTGVFINAVPPEAAAEQLRDAMGRG